MKTMTMRVCLPSRLPSISPAKCPVSAPESAASLTQHPCSGHAGHAATHHGHGAHRWTDLDCGEREKKGTQEW